MSAYYAKKWGERLGVTISFNSHNKPAIRLPDLAKTQNV